MLRKYTVLMQFRPAQEKKWKGNESRYQSQVSTLETCGNGPEIDHSFGAPLLDHF